MRVFSNNEVLVMFVILDGEDPVRNILERHKIVKVGSVKKQKRKQTN